ncbi:MAG: DUF4190 domain-containing protein [Actinobacteria bacterium]|nr:DUF4190 domain-containing protein [Actinomycetota bacterium]
MSDQQPPADEAPARPEPTPEPTPEATSPMPPAPAAEAVAPPPAPAPPPAESSSPAAPDPTGGASTPAATPPPPPGYAPPPTWPPQGAATYPQPPAYAPPGAYAPAGYAYAQTTPTTSTKAIVGLVLAIISWLACPIVPAIIALVLAEKSRQEIAASHGAIGGEGLNTTTRIVSWINIGLFAAIIIGLGLVLLVVSVLAATTQGM